MTLFIIAMISICVNMVISMISNNTGGVIGVGFIWVIVYLEILSRNRE